MYQIIAIQYLPIGPGRAWAFLSDPENLKIITPKHMGFKILSGGDKPMYPGQLIQYTIAPIPGYSTRWVTEITHMLEGEYFVDEQRVGPYAFWHHKHFLKPIQGGVEMIDIVDYKIPFGLLGRLVHSLIIKKELKNIFMYRENKMSERFGKISGVANNLQLKKI